MGAFSSFYFVTTMFGNQKKITRSKHLCVCCNNVGLGRCRHHRYLLLPVGVNIVRLYFSLWNRHGAPNGSWRDPAGLALVCLFFFVFCLSLKYIGLCLHSFLSFDFILFDFFVGVSLAVVALRHLLCGTWFSPTEFSKKFLRFSVFLYKIYSVFIKFRMNYVHWISLYTFITVII